MFSSSSLCFSRDVILASLLPDLQCSWRLRLLYESELSRDAHRKSLFHRRPPSQYLIPSPPRVHLHSTCSPFNHSPSILSSSRASLYPHTSVYPAVFDTSIDIQWLLHQNKRLTRTASCSLRSRRQRTDTPSQRAPASRTALPGSEPCEGRCYDNIRIYANR
jgi:hypothetical protein